LKVFGSIVVYEPGEELELLELDDELEENPPNEPLKKLSQRRYPTIPTPRATPAISNVDKDFKKSEKPIYSCLNNSGELMFYFLFNRKKP